jgi:hypothetical protein
VSDASGQVQTVKVNKDGKWNEKMHMCHKALKTHADSCQSALTTGKLKKKMLKMDETYFLDDGTQIFVWVGKGASQVCLLWTGGGRGRWAREVGESVCAHISCDSSGVHFLRTLYCTHTTGFTIEILHSLTVVVFQSLTIYMCHGHLSHTHLSHTPRIIG